MTTFWGNAVFFKAIFITLFLSIGQFALANPTNLPGETHIFNALKTHYAQNTNDSSLKDLFDLKELNHSWQLFAISDKKFQTIEQFPPNKPTPIILKFLNHQLIFTQDCKTMIGDYHTNPKTGFLLLENFYEYNHCTEPKTTTLITKEQLVFIEIISLNINQKSEKFLIFDKGNPNSDILIFKRLLDKP